MKAESDFESGKDRSHVRLFLQFYSFSKLLPEFTSLASLFSYFLQMCYTTNKSLNNGLFFNFL